MRTPAKAPKRSSTAKLEATERGAPNIPESGALEAYFGALHRLPLLGRQQELELARKIEALEIAHWCALLAYPPALERIGSVLAGELPESAERVGLLLRRLRGRGRKRTGPDRDARKRAVLRTAKALRQLDATRAAQRAVDAGIREAFASDPHARAYLARTARARAAEERAKARFVTANLRLVIAMTRAYHRSMMPLEDLIQEGNLGLMRAVDSFDYRRGYRFSTYAAWWIRHSLNRAVSDKARLVRIPVHALDDMSRLTRAGDRLAVRGPGVPDDDALAAESGLAPEKVAQLKRDLLLRQTHSLDQDIGSDREQNLHEILPADDAPDPERTLDFDRIRAQTERLLGRLKPIEAAILRFRFGLDGGEALTLADVGKRYNLSRERIRQLQEQALAALRVALTELGADELAA